MWHCELLVFAWITIFASHCLYIWKCEWEQIMICILLSRITILLIFYRSRFHLCPKEFASTVDSRSKCAGKKQIHLLNQIENYDQIYCVTMEKKMCKLAHRINLFGKNFERSSQEPQVHWALSKCEFNDVKVHCNMLRYIHTKW